MIDDTIKTVLASQISDYDDATIEDDDGEKDDEVKLDDVDEEEDEEGEEVI